MINIHHLHLNYGSLFTKAAICSLFDPKDGGMRQLKYLQIHNCNGINSRCIDFITKWSVIFV